MSTELEQLKKQHEALGQAALPRWRASLRRSGQQADEPRGVTITYIGAAIELTSVGAAIIAELAAMAGGARCR